MVRLNLNLSDDLATRLRKRAKESGYDDIERFAESILQADAEDQFVDEDLEALLLKRLDDPRPKIEFTPEFQRNFLRELEEQRALGKNNPK